MAVSPRGRRRAGISFEWRGLLVIGGAFVLVGLGWGWLVHRIIAGGEPWSAAEALAAAVTGVVVGGAALPAYLRLRGWHLLWLAPVSLYAAAACYGALEWLLELAIEGPRVLGQVGPDPVRVVYEGPTAAVEMVLAFWAGLTLTVYGPALLVLALLSHGGLRWLVRRGADRERTPTGADAAEGDATRSPGRP